MESQYVPFANLRRAGLGRLFIEPFIGAVTNKTTITLQVLTCESCAKKVAAQLSKLRGVGSVQMDVKSKTAVVVPRDNATLSPLQLWEAIEKAGKTPIKLEGPSGTFTSKPRM